MKKTATNNKLANAGVIYRNGPQIRADLMFCNLEVHRLSRGVGKSQGVIAPRAERLVHEMPRSTGAFVTRTFQKALTNTIPPVIRGWKDSGYVEGVHFVIGKRPPDWFEEPLTKPLDYKYTIPWYNGTVIHLVSQDRPGSANGLSIDWVIADEAKLINKDKFDQEVVPAIRGNRNVFGDLSCHGSIMYCTDRWYGTEAKWIDDLEKEIDKDKIQLIYTLSTIVNKLKNKLLTEDFSKSYEEKLQTKLNNYEKELNRLRKDAVYFSDASAIENIHVLGDDYIYKQRQSLPESVFLVTVLNMKRSLSDSPFYPHLNRNFHLYNSNNHELLAKYNYNFELINDLNCRKDTELKPGTKLYIGLDPGGNFNALVVGIFDMNGRIQIINSFHVEKPELTKHVIKKMCNYYHAHDCHEVVYYYDQTHIGSHGATDLSYRDAVINEFTRNRWDVTAKYLGKVPDPEKRYQLAAEYLGSKQKHPLITFHETNCEYLLISIENADTEEHKGTYRKNKKSEVLKAGIPQEEATHYSDAFDTILWGMHYYPHPRKKYSDITFMSSGK